MYGGESSHLPLKINTAGVMPAIFASALLLLPITISNFGFAESDTFLKISSMFTQGQPLYMLLYASGIIFFSFFYTSIVFNPKETAENLRKYGGYIRHKTRRKDRWIYRLNIDEIDNCWCFISNICLFNAWVSNSKISHTIYLGGTSILIVVSGCDGYSYSSSNKLMSSQYESLIKKTKFGK